MIAAFVRALERANKLAQTDILAAGEAARPMLGKMESSLYVEGVKVMKPALPKTATVSVAGLQNFMNMLVAAGYKFDKVDTNVITANDFVGKALAEKK
jgi:ABC-type nitrate/sulfonate/bicarbonate transport system substrate-binding protein